MMTIWVAEELEMNPKFHLEDSSSSQETILEETRGQEEVEGSSLHLQREDNLSIATIWEAARA